MTVSCEIRCNSVPVGAHMTSISVVYNYVVSMFCYI